MKINQLLKKSLNLLVFVSIYIQSQTLSDSAIVRLPSVDIVANQYKLFSELGRPVRILDSKIIQQLPIRNIDELLELIPGIDIRNRGVGGTQSDISIRGGSFDQVLILLNGVNITDAQTGHYNLNIPVELTDIVRVEVLQGSSFYGTNAFSGAINIVTENHNPTNFSANLSAGSFKSYIQNITTNYTKSGFRTFVSATHKSSAGYISNTDYDIFNLFTQTNLTTQRFGKFDLQLAYQSKSYGANGFYSFTYPNQFDYNKTHFGSLNWNYSVNNLNFNAQTYYRQHYDRFELFRNMDAAPAWYTTHNYHLTDILGIKFHSTILSDLGKFTLGFDFRNEHIFSTALGVVLTKVVQNKFDSPNPFTKSDSRLISTGFLTYSKSLNKFYLTIGLSESYTPNYGFFSAVGLDLTYFINDISRLNLSVNTAHRLPTFTDLYLQNSIQQADANLRPENSFTYEFAYMAKLKNINFNISTFYRIGNNVIDWVKLPDSPKWQSKNMADINAMGVDFDFQYNFFNSPIKSLKVDYSFLNINKQATNFDSKYALDYLKNRLALTVQQSLFFNISVLWKISYFDRDGNYSDFVSNNLLEYLPYTMFDTRFLLTNKHIEYYADINNLLNVSYADFGGISQPSRIFLFGIKYRFK